MMVVQVDNGCGGGGVKRGVVEVTGAGGLVLVLGLLPGGLMGLCADAVVQALGT